MNYLIDGSNLLGTAGENREGEDVKRELLRSVSTFVRRTASKATLYFDGPSPPSFATSLGAVTVVFSGQKQADDLIVARIRNGDSRPWTVVTSDLGLKGRVAGRRVAVVDCTDFRRTLLSSEPPTGHGGDEDWAVYFSDEKNRNVL